MFSLLFTSIKYSKRIFWQSLIEWSLFYGIVFALSYAAAQKFGGFGWLVFPLLTPLSIFISFGQIRNVLLKLGETEPLDLSKLMPTFHSLWRLIGFWASIPLALSIIIFLLTYFLGFLGDIVLSDFRGRSGDLFDAIIAQLPTNPALQVMIGLIVLVYLFSFSACMVPFSAVAATLGEGKKSYDPFFGFGSYKFKAFFMTLIVLILQVLLAAVTLFVATELTGAYLMDIAVTEDTFFVPPVVWICVGIASVFFMFFSNIWFSACALLFSLSNEDVSTQLQKQDQQMYGRQLQDEELRELRRLRMQK